MKLRHSVLFLLPLFLTGALTGCDALSSDADAVPTRTLVGLSIAQLSPDLQDVVDAGGEVVWEVQSNIGRSYASQTALPSPVPASDLLLVLADASTCTPKCLPAEIVPFSLPEEPSTTTVQITEGGLDVTLTLE